MDLQIPHTNHPEVSASVVVGMKRLSACIVCALLLTAFLAGCEKVEDKETGRRGMQLQMPGSETQRQSLERQWRQCMAANSRSVCERRLGGPPPPASQ